MNYFFRSVALVHNNRMLLIYQKVLFILLSWRKLTHNQNPLRQPPRFGNITTMDPVRHVLYRRPWLDDARFGATRAFPASWWMPAVLNLY